VPAAGIADKRVRCEWALSSPLEQAYHDLEWGVPVYDDRVLFEFLTLEGAQAGLSWTTILQKRAAYQKAFAFFDPAEVAAFDGRMKRRLLRNAGIVRNVQKVDSAVGNARALLKVREEFDSFQAYVWQFVGGRPMRNAWRSLREIPAQTRESQHMSADMRRRGFTFVGPTICYAFMQAVGMVNDHIVRCFRYRELSKQKK
jgi:DNA-3-methyladenine glycosylase I